MTTATCTADEAVARIESRQVVFLGSGCGEPQTLVEALIRASGRLRDVVLVTGLQGSAAPYVRPDLYPSFRLRAFMASARVAEAIRTGHADYVPTPLSRIPDLMRRGVIRVDVACVQVAPPDDQGRYSLGVTVAYTKAAVAAAPLVIAEVNVRMPRTLGESFITADDIDLLVAADRPVLEVSRPAVDDVVRAIGAHVATLVPDRATLQVGVGGIAEAVWQALRGHHDLGVHSGSVADSVADLLEAGVITNRYKTIDPDRVVGGQLVGTDRLYRYAHENPRFDMRASDYTHDPRVQGCLEGLVSVNSALQIDLRGQVNAETLRGDQVSGVGGAIDFTVGASLSAGGRSIVALPSTAGSGRYSRIVSRLPDGVVTTPSSLVDFVVTEFGIAELSGRSLDERARALIEIADPRHRVALRDAVSSSTA